jgi:N-acetylglucosaminyldiphosphoundecaprenol N-acetyl-beta-D-mannosaminyltransferase
MSVDSYRVLGARVDAVRRADVVPIFDDWIRRRHRSYVVLTGVHGVIEMQDDPSLRAVYEGAGLSTPDGMPIVWMGWREGHPRVEKVYAPDVMELAFAAGVERGWRHFLYGGDEGVADTLAAALEARFPGIAIAGRMTPPFRALTEAEKVETARAIDAARADIVWVGLGCPKQERWMAEMRPRLEAPVLVGVGAGFDFLSGRKPLAPVWVQRSGFEWLFRLVSEPRRLWPRYSRIVPRFVSAIAREEWRRLRG